MQQLSTKPGPPLSKLTKQLMSLEAGKSIFVEGRLQSTIARRAQRLGITVLTKTVRWGKNIGKLEVYRVS